MYVGVIKELLNPHDLQESDIVIVNLGAWYFLGELGQGEKVRKRCFRTRARVEGEHFSPEVTLDGVHSSKLFWFGQWILRFR